LNSYAKNTPNTNNSRHVAAARLVLHKASNANSPMRQTF